MKHGFTLLELMAVLAVLGLLTAVSALGWRESRPEPSAAVLFALTLARTEAIRGGHSTTWHRGSTTIRFFPDGSSSGGAVVDNGVRIEIDALTGQARAAR